MPTIKTLDLALAKDPHDLHKQFAALLDFPSYYGNNWDAFWDAITGLVEMPDVLILYNHLHFTFRFPAEGDALIRMVGRYNEFPNKKHIEHEELCGLRAGKIASIFKQRPSQFGLRGDPHLWSDLEAYFAGKPVPANEEELVAQLHSTIRLLVDWSPESGKDHTVQAYNAGGMSGGMLSADFWERRAIPLLIGRYRAMKDWSRQDELCSRTEVLKGDITKFIGSAIVNAANTSLLGGGGVDGAIHRAGGPAILEDCRKIIARQGGCKTGEAVITTAGNLLAAHVIHTVGPVWRGGHNNEARLLESCYTNSLRLAAENKCTTVAFPCISTGIYGYPVKDAAEVATTTVLKFLENNDSIDRVSFVCFDEENYHAIADELDCAL